MVSPVVVIRGKAQLGVGPQSLRLVGDPRLVVRLDCLRGGRFAVERVGGPGPGPVVLAGVVDVVIARHRADTPRSRGLRLRLLVAVFPAGHQVLVLQVQTG